MAWEPQALRRCSMLHLDSLADLMASGPGVRNSLDADDRTDGDMSLSMSRLWMRAESKAL